jgi:hypothetical protein
VFVSATANGGTVTQTNGVVIMDLGSVTNDSPVTITIQAMPSQPDVLINRTSVGSAEADLNPADNVSYELALSVVLITAVEKLGSDLRLSFESSAGKHYVVQDRSDLQSGEWVNVPGTAATGTGHTLRATVANPFGQPSEFYRVVLQP